MSNSELLPDFLAQELHALCLASLDGSASDADIARLDQLVCENAAARDYLARSLQTCNHLRLWAAAHQKNLPTIQDASPERRSTVLGFLGGLLHAGDTPFVSSYMWLVLAVVCSGMALTIFFCVSLAFHGVSVNVHIDAPQVAQGKVEGKSDGREQGAASQSLPSPVLGRGRAPSTDGRGEGIDSPSLATTTGSGATVARLIHVADCHWVIGSHSPHVGDDLAPGRKLVLMSGLAEVMFESGVKAVLQGPATLEIGSRTSAGLLRGKLTVTVIDPELRGFQVHTPGMTYTDLGTEFGVFVAKDGSQEMHVFRGTVQAEAAGSSEERENVRQGERETGDFSSSHALTFSRASSLSHPSSLVLSAHQAVRISAPGKPIEKIAADEKQFVRAMAVPKPFPLFSTGVGLDRGASDSHWEIIAMSNKPTFKPQPAVVAAPFESYVQDNRATAQWISNSTVRDGMPGGCRWTLRTYFDLTGFDPATARIEGRVSVDDYLAEARLNGKPIPLAPEFRSARLCKMWTPLRFDDGFVAGQNTLELVIENRPYTGDSVRDAMALCVDWKGTARPLEKSSRER
jgi:hypothetical protein